MSKGTQANLTPTSDRDALAQALERELVEAYGFILNSEQLAKVLAFGSKVAFRHAAYRGHLPVKVFPIEHRKGHFALAKDVAGWMATIRMPGQKTLGEDAM